MRTSGPTIALIMVATFGPYIAQGMRTEQVAVYTVALIAAVSLLGQRLPTELIPIAAIWTVYAAVAAIGAAAPPPINRTGFEYANPAAGLDNLVLPLAAALIAVWLSKIDNPGAVLRSVSGWTVVLMLLNTAAAFLQSEGLRDWSAWWSADDAGFTVATNAAGNGRFSGLINQPAEAGFLYGIAMLAAIYLWSSSRPRVLLVTLAVLGYGGVFTVSKVFLLVALPIVLWQLLTSERGRSSRLFSAGLVGLGAYVIIQAGWLPAWAGSDQLAQILPSGGQSILSAITASRFGETSTLRPTIEGVLRSDGFFGMGAAGLSTPYDNGLVEALVFAGAVGVICYALTVLLWVKLWLRADHSPERVYMGGLVLLAAGASVGLPALTANRAATVLWLLMTLLVITLTATGRKTREPEIHQAHDSRTSRLINPA